MEQSDFHERFSGSDFNVERSSRSVTCQTFELTLRSCLYPHIERRYIECCGNLMKTLKKDYRSASRLSYWHSESVFYSFHLHHHLRPFVSP